MAIICKGCGHDISFHTPYGCQHYGCGCNEQKLSTHSERNQRIITSYQTKEKENGNITQDFQSPSSEWA